MNVSDALAGVRQVAFDTAPLIYFIEKHPRYFPVMKAIVERIRTGEITAVSSTLTLTEVLIQPIRTNNTELAQQYERVLRHSRGFTLIPVTSEVARQAAVIRASHNLKTPDALHVASAIVSGSDAFLTNDTDLSRVSDLNVILLNNLTTQGPRPVVEGSL